MDPIKKAAQDLAIKSQHIQEVLHPVVDKLSANQVSDVEINVAFRPEIVPDLTKLGSGEDTMVGNISLFITAKPGQVEAMEKLRDRITAIHSRHVLVGDMLADGSFPVTFHVKVSEIETKEYFKVYSEVEGASVEQWAAKAVAEDVWNFLRRGTQPV